MPVKYIWPTSGVQESSSQVESNVPAGQPQAFNVLNFVCQFFIPGQKWFLLVNYGKDKNSLSNTQAPSHFYGVG